MDRRAIGLIGWGTVGGGVVEILEQDGALLRDRCGLDVQLKTVVTRSPGRARERTPKGALITDRLAAILDDPEIAIVIHLVPGTTVAAEVCAACLNAGKHVVTANKAMLAEGGDALFALAARKGVAIAFEASVAGGIPVIAALRDGLVANRIDLISGILNGTCNYILTRMEAAGISYGEALAEAQQLGYAERDPTLDVDGTDTAHKLAILARIAFGSGIPVSAIRREGIDRVTYQDIASAKLLGSRIKLLAIAKRRAGGIELRVAPTLVPLDHPLASVNKNYNGVFLRGHAAGDTLLVGQGAGALPTASAVLADVIDLATGRYQMTAQRFRFFASGTPATVLPESEEVTAGYVRFAVNDRPGVLAGIASTLSNHGVSLLSLHQSEADPTGQTCIEAITHPHQRASFRQAIASIDSTGLTTRPSICFGRF